MGKMLEIFDCRSDFFFFVTKKLRTLLILFINIPNTLNMKQGA
ncbi:hypothetical protein FP2_22770 [Faecalibacterium prausnitzii L2-6]|uniref:Uncharacterized protein n=1 Tax=Faecalibacterium prausnitzii L2-6 TaxID=718252 RepID=D4K023_9FIRM|nr:hypothetical protein FP2_22770 [Faecalibacterium prausnitzii L2-6]